MRFLHYIYHSDCFIPIGAGPWAVWTNTSRKFPILEINSSNSLTDLFMYIDRIINLLMTPANLYSFTSILAARTIKS